MRFLFILTLCAGAGLASQAGAVSLGDTVTCSATLNYYCKHTPILATPISAIVGAGTEFEIDYVGSANGRFTVDFSDSHLKLTALSSFQSGAGLGRVLTFGDLTHPITGITSFLITLPRGTSTSITQNDFSVNQGAITLALDGTGISKGVTIDIGLASAVAPAVPEPSTWAMMLCGFGLIGAAIRCRPRASGGFA